MEGDADELIRLSEAIAKEQAEIEGRRHMPRRLQPGEDPSSRYPGDAIHWSAVYAELITFKRELLGLVEEKMRSTSAAGVSAELAHDRDILRTELRRLQLHYDFWHNRLPPGRREPPSSS